MVNNFFEQMQRTELFAGMTEEEAERMLSCFGAQTAAYPRGSYILREGETGGRLGVLLDGRALIIQEDFWGNRSLLSALEPGELFAETFACVPGSALSVSVAAKEACTVLFLDMERVFTMCPSCCRGHAQLVRSLLQELAMKNLRLNERLTHLGKRTTKDKLLSYLSARARQHGKREFDIPFTRQQLADYLCVDRSGLSVELGKMKREGILDFHKNHVVLRQAEE